MMRALLGWSVPGLSVAAAALLLAAFIGMLGIAPAAAQSGPGDEQISVRIIARNADNDRVELGLIEDGQSADNPILPSARFLSWASVDAADVTDWRYSSAVAVGGEPGATVRIAARGRDGDRIEFGLQQRGADGEWSDLPAPQARFFTRATTHTRWLRSSPLQVAPPQAAAEPPSDDQSEGPVAVVTEQAPVIDAISCEPESPAVDEAVTCSAGLSGGEPDSYAWSGGGDPADGSDAGFTTTFDSAGDQTISLTVTNTLGNASDSITFTVAEASEDDPLEAPVIDAISCEPESPFAGENITCSAELSGGEPDSYAWSGGGDPADGSDASFTTMFDSIGEQTISLTVANDIGDDAQSITLDILEPPPPPPTIDSLSCSAQIDGTVRCSAAISDDHPPVSYAWSGNGDPATGSNAEFTTSFDSVGDQTISLTVSNSNGSASASTVVAVEQAMQPPTIESIDCTPASPEIGDTVTCTADLSGDAPDFYTWRGGGDPPGGNDANFSTTFASAGARTISLAISNIVGDDSASTTVTVQGELREPVLDGIECEPNSPIAGQSVTCRGVVSGGPPTTYTWSGDGQPAAGNSASFTTTFASAGNQTVTLLVANDYGSSITLTHTIVVLEPPQAPVVESVSCMPASPTVGQTVTCTASISGGEPSSYAWTGGVYATAVPNGETYTTSFNSAGSHTVRFTALNTAGSNTQSTTVNVQPAPSE